MASPKEEFVKFEFLNPTFKNADVRLEIIGGRAARHAKTNFESYGTKN